MDNYTLRALTEADYDAVYSLWTHTEGMALGESDTREAIAMFLRRNPGLSPVACDGRGTIVGAVLCGHDGRRGYLHHLAVASEHRRHGIGRGLVECCLTRLKALNIPRCNLMLLEDNLAGRAFWEAEGWVVRRDILMVQKRLSL